MGCFVSESEGLLHSEDVEVKWAYHSEGDRKCGWKADDAVTLAILVRGRMRVQFDEGFHPLKREGDYVIWDRGVRHLWVADEDSLVVTVRWPSKREGLNGCP